MEALHNQPWAAMSVGLLILLGLQTVRLWWGRMWPRWQLLRRSARAQQGEEAAADVLRALGYAIESAQAQGSWTIAVDGSPLPIGVRADYLVTRNGRRYVAEVKTGHSAPSLRSAATRRQLLEYRLAYEVDGVLLVDMERGRVHDVEFPLDGGGGDLGTRTRTRWLTVAVLVVLGFALGRYSGSGATTSVKAGSSNIGSPASGGSGTSTSSRP